MIGRLPLKVNDHRVVSAQFEGQVCSPFDKTIGTRALTRLEDRESQVAVAELFWGHRKVI